MKSKIRTRFPAGCFAKTQCFIASGLMMMKACKPRYMLTSYLALYVIFLIAAMTIHGTASTEFRVCEYHPTLGGSESLLIIGLPNSPALLPSSVLHFGAWVSTPNSAVPCLWSPSRVAWSFPQRWEPSWYVTFHSVSSCLPQISKYAIDYRQSKYPYIPPWQFP